jgi:hypothetical protein
VVEVGVRYMFGVVKGFGQEETMTRKGQKQKTKEEIHQEAQRLRAAEAAREAAVAADESVPEVFEDQTKFDKMVGSGQSHAGAQV